MTKAKLYLPHTIYMIVMPLLGIAGTWYWIDTGAFNWKTIALAFVGFVLVELSLTAGYHRLYAHRAYEASWILRFLYLLIACAAIQGPAIVWVIDHRNHHKYVDDNEKDPYSINKGFAWAHILWLFYSRYDQFKNKPRSIARDLLKDPLIMWQQKYWIPLGIAVGFFLPALIAYSWNDAWGGFFVAGILRSVIVHHCTFLVNSLAHYWGDQPFSNKNSSRENFIVALLSMGEGYHNFHHEFPSDYRNGHKLHHWDPTKWFIKLMTFIGLAKNLKITSPELIQKKLKKPVNKA